MTQVPFSTAAGVVTYGPFVLKMAPSDAPGIQRHYVGWVRGQVTAGEFFSAIAPRCDSSNSVLREQDEHDDK